MTVADTFTGAKSGFTFLYAYQGTVAQEIGAQRAIALHSRMAKAMGTAQGKALKERVDGKEIAPKLAASLAGTFLEQALGIQSRLAEGTAEKAVIEVGRCPLYEAAEVLGVENAGIEAWCRAGAIQYMDALVKQFSHDLDYDLSQFRPSADGPCIEMIVASGR
jgi:hypothetical protein